MICSDRRRSLNLPAFNLGASDCGNDRLFRETHDQMLDHPSTILPASYLPGWIVRIVVILLLVLLGSVAFPSTSHAHGLHAVQPDLSQQLTGDPQQDVLNQAAAAQEEADCALGCCLVGSCLTVIGKVASHDVALKLYAAVQRPSLERWEIFDTGAGTRRPPKA